MTRVGKKGRSIDSSTRRRGLVWKVITLQIDAEDEGLIRSYADLVGEMKDSALTAPDGSVLDICEEAVVEKGREHQRWPLLRGA